MSSGKSYDVLGWREGKIENEWHGRDEILARDAARELFACGFEVEAFKDGRWLGWVERADGTLAGDGS